MTFCVSIISCSRRIYCEILVDLKVCFLFITSLPSQASKIYVEAPHHAVLVPKYGKRNISAASVGTEEMAHFEMVATIVHQLTRNLTPEEIKESGFGNYYIDHTLGVWPQAAGGIPQNACEFQVKGDPITDIMEDMAADGAMA